MKKSNKILLIVLFLIVVILLGEYLAPSFLATIKAIKWHLVHDENISIGNIKLKLNFKWWVYSKETNRIYLTMIPPLGIDFYGLISIENKYLSKDALKNLDKERNFKRKKLKFRKYDQMFVGSELAFGIIYDVISEDNKRENVFEVWTIPSKKIVITVIDLPEKYRSYFERLVAQTAFI